MTRAEEKVLVEQAQTDPRQFDALYRSFIDEIYRFIFYRTSSKEVTEDLTAQVFMHALERLDQFHYRAGARFSSWLYRIARNQVIDHYRKTRPQLTLEEVEPIESPATASQAADSHLQQQQVREILQRLPESDREILQLRLWQDQSYTAMAQVLGSNAVAMRARYSRALKKFKQLFTEHYGTTN